MEKNCNPEKLHQELERAGLPVVSVDIFANAEFSRPLSEQEQQTAKQIIQNHDPDPSPEERCRAAYLAAGITPEALIAALWEKVVEGRPASADELQARREAIKALYTMKQEKQS